MAESVCLWLAFVAISADAVAQGYRADGLTAGAKAMDSLHCVQEEAIRGGAV